MDLWADLLKHRWSILFHVLERHVSCQIPGGDMILGGPGGPGGLGGPGGAAITPGGGGGPGGPLGGPAY